MLYEDRQWDVPCFETTELKPKESDYCVCIFVINEGEKLLKQLGAMEAVDAEFDLVVADGGSTDGSTKVDNLIKFGVNTLLVKMDKGKLGAQMRMAFAWSLMRGYKGVVVIDGNNKDGVSAIPQFLTLLREGYDHVQGSRFIKGGVHKRTPLSRLFGVKFLHAPLISWASGFHYTDTTNGFRAYSARLLSDRRISVFRNVFQGYELHYFLAIEAVHKGFDVIETPVSRIYPSDGTVPTKISPILGSFNVLFKLFLVVSGQLSLKSKT